MFLRSLTTSSWLRKNCNHIFTYQQLELVARHLHPELAVRYLHPELSVRYLHPELAVRHLHPDTSSQILHPDTYFQAVQLSCKCNYSEFGHITVSKLIYVQN